MTWPRGAQKRPGCGKEWGGGGLAGARTQGPGRCKRMHRRRTSGFRIRAIGRQSGREAPDLQRRGDISVVFRAANGPQQ